MFYVSALIREASGFRLRTRNTAFLLYFLYGGRN
jgi:hypothetical protein